MDYNNLLNKLSSSLKDAKKTSQDNLKKIIPENKRNVEQNSDTSTLLNKIGLEIQRQGGQ